MKHAPELKKSIASSPAFVAAYCAGTGVGFLISSFREAPIRETSAEASGNWGLSFPNEGERPVGNADISELSALNAAYCEDTDEKVIYLTFDCGYENGNTEAILDALKKHDAPAAFLL